MFFFFLDLTSTFVIPLLTLFIMGRFTRVHRSSGTVGLLVGATYGIVRLFEPEALPDVMANDFAAYSFAVLVTAGTMFLTSLLMGWQPRGEVLETRAGEALVWLRSSQQAVQALDTVQDSGESSTGFSRAIPAILAVAVVALGCYLCFVVFW